jgi:AraC-like DNA-binding protein
MALAAPFSLTRFENGGAEFTDESLHAALIPPGQRHCLRAGGGMGFVYLDALSDDHESATVADLHTHRAAFIEALRGGWSVDDLCSCIGLPRKPPPDPRIAALLREIDANPNVFPRLDVAADFVGVSPSRCRELMRLAPGVPFRRYRLWRRFALVIREVSRGHTLTGAALDAGFASSAHLSAAFKAMFGLAPSSITKLGAAIDVD